MFLSSTLNGTMFIVSSPLGAIFTPGSEEMQTAFNYAISFHNNNETQARFKVEPVVEVLDSDDSYKIGQTCK